MITKQKILIVDDENDMRETMRTILKNKYLVQAASSGQDALDHIKKATFSLVLLDLRMPKMDGVETLKKIRETDPSLPVIIVSASKDIKSAVECIKIGAEDYISKPFEVDELMAIIDKSLEKKQLIKENMYLKEISGNSRQLIGNNHQIIKIKELIGSIAPTDSTVLIQGESGTGKEIAARSIHDQSSRKNKPFVAINCAAIPENLLESELFGYERGAFTGAIERKIGKFELADGGTLFLDEIGCMSPSMQSKLLRILEEKAFERLGGNTRVEVDVRIISATNIDFDKTISEGKFRGDLYYRLNVIPIKMPPLRERRDDLDAFISYFIIKFNKDFNKKITRIAPAVYKRLASYEFPGNVRELQNLMERAVALSPGETIHEESIFGLSSQNSQDSQQENIQLKDACEAFERNIITKTLRDHNWNQTKAAQKLGIARTTLASKVTIFGIKETSGF